MKTAETNVSASFLRKMAADHPPTQPIKRIGKQNFLLYLLSFLTGFVVFIILLIVSSFFPLTWDEGETNYRANCAAAWFHGVALQIPGLRQCCSIPADIENNELVSQDVPLSLYFSDWGIDSYWIGTTIKEGHPLFPVILTALGKGIAPHFLPHKTKIRFGNIFFFSIISGCLFYRLKQMFNWETAWFGCFSILLIPRLFAHIQIAFWDSPLITSWLLCWILFPPALKSTRGAALFGIALGLAFSSKFPGWTVPLPFLIWLTLKIVIDPKGLQIKRAELLKQGCLAAFLSLFVFYLLNPPLWIDPVNGFQKFVYLNTHRELLIPTLFLGNIYDLHHSLPWYNTIVWTAITVPAGLLVLFLTGLFVMFCKPIQHSGNFWTGLLILLNFLTLIIVRSFPGTPVHEGIRLFIAAFPFLAIFSGIGAAALWKHKITKTIIIVIYSCCLFNMFWYAPQWLSFYNLAIGGLPGAVRAGMEPTYYWDGFDGEVMDWLNARTNQDDYVVFSVCSDATFSLYGHWKQLTPRIIIANWETSCAEIQAGQIGGKPFRYYVFQCRSGMEFEYDRDIQRDFKPVYIKTIRKGGIGPWNLGVVPIIKIYDLQNKTIEPEPAIESTLRHHN